jgi:hypothetical protein
MRFSVGHLFFAFLCVSWHGRARRKHQRFSRLVRPQ